MAKTKVAEIEGVAEYVEAQTKKAVKAAVVEIVKIIKATIGETHEAVKASGPKEAAKVFYDLGPAVVRNVKAQFKD